MTWVEFQLRLLSFNRVQEKEWNKVRYLSTWIIKSGFLSAQDKKRELNGIVNQQRNGGLSQHQKSILLKAQERHNKTKK